MARNVSVDDMRREEILEASKIPPERKLALGLELFDRVRAVMLAGIRDQHPDANESEIRRILVQRLEIARRLENRA